jgi:hypothetical protein
MQCSKLISPCLLVRMCYGFASLVPTVWFASDVRGCKKYHVYNMKTQKVMGELIQALGEHHVTREVGGGE